MFPTFLFLIVTLFPQGFFYFPRQFTFGFPSFLALCLAFRCILGLCRGFCVVRFVAMMRYVLDAFLELLLWCLFLLCLFRNGLEVRAFLWLLELAAFYRLLVDLLPDELCEVFRLEEAFLCWISLLWYLIFVDSYRWLLLVHLYICLSFKFLGKNSCSFYRFIILFIYDLMNFLNHFSFRPY